MAYKKKLVVLTGAGISAESGVATFRDSGGLWEGHNVMDVASPEGWRRDPKLVLEFYNKRRQQLHSVQPHTGHFILAELESDFDVHIITQNVDNLHERAGSTKILHLHGELLKVRSVADPDFILNWEHDLLETDTDNHANPLRPHIVWFGEAVPALEEAIDISAAADIFVVVGTSLQVYPAAGLMDFTADGVPVYYIDPNPARIINLGPRLTVIPKVASEGVSTLRELLLKPEK
ncbi:MAG TPA: NAD-dependent deacylase [Flavobacterium sp.]|jgi:NAD-dependent deacetylase